MEATRGRQLEIYQTEEGRRPFLDWLRGLRDTTTRARIRARLDRVALGNFGNCRAIESGVSELKIDFGPGYRVYFGADGDRVIVLLYGGDKSSQTKDIEIAKSFWADYRRRDGEA